MNKIRKIIINCASGGESTPKPRTTVYHFDEDSLDELENELKALQEDWISVEDELPKDNKNDEDREFIVQIVIEHSCVYPVTSAQWDREEQKFYKGIEYLKVIHWQPLPKLPKEK